MLYRIIALFALFFFAACGGGGPRDLEPQGRKAVNQYGTPTPPMVYTPQQVMDTAPKPDVKVVKIGLLVPLTGQASEVGTALMDAATLALMDKYGHADRSDGRVKVVLVPKDTKGTPQGAAAAAQEVMTAGVELVVGPLFSQNVAPVASIAKQRGVNVLTFSNNPDVAGDNVFVFGFQADQQVERILNYALNRNLASVALLAPNNAYGAGVKKSANATMQASGLTLVDEQYYNPHSNAEAEIAAIAATHAKSPLNAMLVPEGGRKLEAIINSLRARDIAQPNVRFLGTGLWDEPTVLRSGTLAGGWFASSPPDRFIGYERRFKDFFDYTPPRLSALAYDAMALAANMAMAEGGADFSVNALTDPIGYNGPVNGIFRCHSSGMCERGLAVLEVTGKGEAKVIDAAPRSF